MSRKNITLAVFAIIALFCLWSRGYGQCLQMDIMLVGDMSGSVEGYEHVVSDAFEAFVYRLDMSSDGIRMGVVRFSSDATMLCGLTSNKAAVVKSLLFSSADGSTNMADAIMMAGNELMSNGRPGSVKLIVLISDGDPDSGDEVVVAINQLKLININLCAVVIHNDHTNTEFMKSISSCYVESDYDALVDELKRMDVCL